MITDLISMVDTREIEEMVVLIYREFLTFLSQAEIMMNPRQGYSWKGYNLSKSYEIALEKCLHVTLEASTALLGV